MAAALLIAGFLFVCDVLSPDTPTPTAQLTPYAIVNALLTVVLTGIVSLSPPTISSMNAAHFELQAADQWGRRVLDRICTYLL